MKEDLAFPLLLVLLMAKESDCLIRMSLFVLGSKAINRIASLRIENQLFRCSSTTAATSNNIQRTEYNTTMEPSDYFSELPSLEPSPTIERNLSPKVIKDRVKARVAERMTWPEVQYFPTNTAFLKYLCRNFRDVVYFKVPTDLDQVFPLQTVDWDSLRKPLSSLQVTWIGHASLFLQMDGCNILTDPVFSERCAPTQFAGPKRFRPPAFFPKHLMEEEIALDIILISHNHYDHLDYKSIVDLVKAFPNVTLVVPLGLKSWFVRHVNKNLKIVELDWHETFSHAHCSDEQTINITAVPMLHWSNRNGWDRDKSLWCGFVISGKSQKFLFPGDTGWFDGLHELGRRYGPFDMAALPIGAYQPSVLMRASHTNPEEAVEMFHALKCKQAVPIHWGTFPLTLEPVMEPRERLKEAVEAAGIDATAFSSWLIGETVVSNKSK